LETKLTLLLLEGTSSAETRQLWLKRHGRREVVVRKRNVESWMRQLLVVALHIVILYSWGTVRVEELR
jgi:hypothetical protein